MADYKTKFSELTRLKYVDQAKFYLNGFWTEGAEKEAENVWVAAHKFIELDDKKKGDGCELDEFQAHKFLESLGETLTVVALREKLRKIDLDANGKMALLEYLAYKYSKTVEAVVDSPQGDNSGEVGGCVLLLPLLQLCARMFEPDSRFTAGCCCRRSTPSRTRCFSGSSKATELSTSCS
jgi:hypothetical protein